MLFPGVAFSVTNLPEVYTVFWQNSPKNERISHSRLEGRIYKCVFLHNYYNHVSCEFDRLSGSNSTLLRTYTGRVFFGLQKCKNAIELSTTGLTLFALPRTAASACPQNGSRVPKVPTEGSPYKVKRYQYKGPQISARHFCPLLTVKGR